MAHCSSSAEDIHRADANIKGITRTVCMCCDVMWAKLDKLYLTIILRARVGYKMIYSQRGA